MKKPSSTIAIVTMMLILQHVSAQTIQSSRSTAVTVDSAKGIRVHSSRAIETHKSKEITPYQSKPIEVHTGKTIDAVKSGDARSSNAVTVPPDPAPVHGSAMTGKDNPLPASAPSESGSKPKIVDVEKLFGTWHTKVPGAVWQTPSGREGYDNLHVSAGAASGDLIINRNGTYTWNSYGGKKGKWEKGDSGYPIVLIDTAEKKRWRVGVDERHSGGRDIIIWDGYVWYDGKK